MYISFETVLLYLQGQAMSRIPCVQYLLDKAPLLKSPPRLSADQLYYLVNPDGSLPKVELRLLPYLRNHPHWSGEAGVIPTQVCEN